MEAPTLRERVMYDEAFQAACQRYAHSSGSSDAIAAAAVNAIGADQLLDALREQVGECFDDSCEMCARHQQIIDKARGEDR